MDPFDLAVLVLMALLAVFFAGVAVLEWREARGGQPADAQVIQHPKKSDQRANPAA